MPFTYNQTLEILGLSKYEALTLYPDFFPKGQRLAGSCHRVFYPTAINAFLCELRLRGELYDNVKLAIGRPLDI